MPFEKTFENSYHELSQATKYRFAEVEMYYAVQALTDLFRQEFSPRHSAIKTIFNIVIPKQLNIEEIEQHFFQLLATQPQKKEIIHYLLLKGHSYAKIRSVTSASPNLIAQMRYGLPIYYPRFNRWDEEMMQKWDTAKRHINLFNENLVHTKE
jgi:hypothetical protein